MTMSRRARRITITAHLSFSVGWLGAVASFLALAIATLNSRDLRAVQGTYLAMAVTGWYVIVPLCLGSLTTGLLAALGTPWGLFRHYWVLVKFLLTLVSALILFGFTRTLSFMEELAAHPAVSFDSLCDLKQSPAIHSGGGLLVLLATTIIAVYKPWGLTPYGQRKRTAHQPDSGSTAGLPRRAYLLLAFIVLVLLFLILHLIQGGPVRHL